MKKIIKKSSLMILLLSLISSNGLTIGTSAVINDNENLLKEESIDKIIIEPYRNIRSANTAKDITRADAVSSVIKMMKDTTANNLLSLEDTSEAQDLLEFNDIDKNMAGYEDIIYAQKIGLVQGNGMQKFFPDNNLTKKDYAKIVGRMFDILQKYGVEYKLPNPNVDDLKDYTDYHLLKGDEENYYSILMQLGIIEPKKISEVKSPELVTVTELLDAKGNISSKEIDNLKVIMDKIDKTNFTISEKIETDEK